jgi:myosin heavy subunit
LLHNNKNRLRLNLVLFELQGGGEYSEESSNNSSPDSLSVLSDSEDLAVMLKAGLQQGKTRVFLRQNTFNFFEMKKLEVTVRAVIKVQACIRGYRNVRRYSSMREASVVLQVWL